MPAENELPISVKGILGPPGRVALLRNEHGRWALPGGRLEPHESACPFAVADQRYGLTIRVSPRWAVSFTERIDRTPREAEACIRVMLA